MNGRSTKWNWWRACAGFILFTIVLLAAQSAWKYWRYEQNDAAPRLRKLVGSEVVIPEQTFSVLGEERNSGPFTGTLEYVEYRLNDTTGWFDLEIRVKSQNGSLWTGLSPDEARAVLPAI